MAENKAYYLEIKAGCLKYLESFRASFMFGGKVWTFPTASEQTRHCAQASGCIWSNEKDQERPAGKKGRGQKLEGGGETGGLAHSLVMKRIMIKVSQGLIMSQIDVASSV